jgi:serine/threonine-protein kinase
MPSATSSDAAAEKISGTRYRLQSTHRLGDVLANRYHIRGFMDSGGTAEIFLADDAQTNEPVVIKQLTEKLADNSEVRHRFLHEATAAEAIDHPNVVQVKAVIEPSDQPPFLVMEALSGETLGDALRRDERLPITQCLELVVEVGSALRATHEAGVVHRDVKPDNIFLLGEAGNPHAVKLIDFGMAKIKTVPCRGTTVLGTAQYMAPEQILVEHVDGRADVYGLGVVMFRMLTGHLPFESEPRADMLRHQLFSPPPPASWLCDGLSPLVDSIVLRAMRKHPDNRYTSMAALLEDVTLALKNREKLDSALDDNLAPTRQLTVQPDTYVPSSTHGKAALELLARKFGKYATASAASDA